MPRDLAVVVRPDPPVSVVLPVADAVGERGSLARTLAALAAPRLHAPELDVVVAGPAVPQGTADRASSTSVRVVHAMPGDLVAVGAGVARAPWCVVLAPGDEPPAATVAEWRSGRGAALVPTALLRAIGGSDATVAVRLRALAPRAPSMAPVRASSPTPTSGQGADSFDQLVRSTLDLLSELEHVPAPTEEAVAAVREAAATELTPLRAHLEAHPDDHARLVAEVEARGLRQVDWSLLNAGRADELALLYCFTPWNDTSAMVAARRVRARGVVVDVVSQQMDNIRVRDEPSRDIARPFIGDHRVVPGLAGFAGWDKISQWSKATARVVEDRARSGRHYRSVYSRAMFPASHVAGALHKIRHPASQWRAEFSDPLSRDVHGLARSAQVREGDLLNELRAGLKAAGADSLDHLELFPWVEHLVYALADEVVFTNANQRDYMLGYCPDPALRARVEERSTVSHHPTLPPTFYHREPSNYGLAPDRFHIGYFGVFYATRGLAEVTDALAGLPAPVRARLQLHIFTSDSDEIAAGVAAAGLADVVRVNGYRPFLEFLNLTTRFDVLLVNDAHHEGTNPYLPSKLSDYLGSGSDVWALSEPGSVLSRQPVAYASALGDVDAAAAVLARIADRMP